MSAFIDRLELPVHGVRIGSRRAEPGGATGARRVGRDRHRDRRVHRHAGPAHGQAAPRGVLRRRDGRGARGRGVQLPPGPRDGDGSRPRLRDRGWEQGYGDFDTVPDFATFRRFLARGDGARARRRDVARRKARRAVAAPGAPRADRTCRGARAHADGRLGARVLSRARDLRGRACEGLRGPHAVRPVHPRLPHPRLDLRRAAAALDPEQHAGGGDPGRDVQGRGVAGPAGDQLPVRGRPDDGRQPRDLQERRQGDRVPARLRDQLHGEAVRVVDRQLLPHPREPLARRPQRLRPRRLADGALPGRFLAGQIACARSSRSSSPRRSTRTSAMRRAAGRRHARLGARQPHARFRVVGHGRALRVETRIPGGEPTRTSRSRRRSPPGSTASRTSRASRSRSRERVRVARRQIPEHDASTRSTRWRRAPSLGPRSATRSSITTSTTRTPNRGCSIGTSPTGNESATSSGPCSPFPCLP